MRILINFILIMSFIVLSYGYTPIMSNYINNCNTISKTTDVALKCTDGNKRKVCDHRIEPGMRCPKWKCYVCKDGKWKVTGC